VTGPAATFQAADGNAPRGSGGGRERSLYGGRGQVRPAVGLDGGTVGTWTVRAGCTVGSGQRPGRNCADSFAVWCLESQLFVAVGAADPSAAGLADGVQPAELGISELIKVARARPRAPAHTLLGEMNKVIWSSWYDAGLVGPVAASFAIGVFAQHLPAHGRGVATLAASGPRVGAWILGENGSPANVLVPAKPGMRALDNLEVLDGDVVCIATSALALPADGERFRPLWNETPEEPAFLQFLLGTTHRQPDSAALVAMWSGHYEVTLP
jgi:hypothetical protein